jgi:AcrR family transcriptional regulator
MEKSNETKNRLLEAACEAFREKGYEKAKVSDIVSKADLAQGTFYLYFKTKKDCLNTLMTELMKDFLEDMREEYQRLDKDSIFKLAAMLCESLESHSEIIAIMHFEQDNIDEHTLNQHNALEKEIIGLVFSALKINGASESCAEIKTYLIDALISHHLLNNVYVKNAAIARPDINLLDKILTVINEVDCR